MNDTLTGNKAIIRGNGNITLVFLHYFGGSAESWRWVVNKLSLTYRCVCINLPGFGGTAGIEHPSVETFASYVQEQLANLGVKEYVLTGHSMGGKVAVQVAANERLTQRVKHLILLAPSPPTIERKPESEKQRMLNHPSAEEAARTVKGATFAPLGTEEYAVAVATQNVADNNVWRWWLQEGMNHSIAGAVVNLTLPITVIASKDDPAVTYKMTLEDTMPNLPSQARLVTTDKIGHLYPLEAAGWLAELLKIIIG